MSATLTNHVITVNALASYSGDDAPSYEVLVDGVDVGTGVVDSNNLISQSFTVAVPDATAETVSIVFTNYNSSSQMLEVQSIAVDKQVILTSESGETYVSSHGTYDQWSQMYFGGQINIPVAASEFSGGTAAAGGSGTSSSGGTGAGGGTSSGGTSSSGTSSSGTSSSGTSSSGTSSGDTGAGGTSSVGGSSAGGSPVAGDVTYAIGVVASASYNVGAPAIALVIDGQTVGTGTFTSASSSTLTFNFSLTPDVSHTVVVEYTNHTSSSQMLNVSGVTINGQTVATSEAGEQYVSPQGTYNQWGQMYFGGQINLPVAASYFSAASGTGTGTGSTGGSSGGAGGSGGTTSGSAGGSGGTTGSGAGGSGGTTGGGTTGGSGGASGMAIYVSPTGSDGNAGTASSPFATFGRAIQAMEQDGIHTLYVYGGSYAVTSTIQLGSQQDQGDKILAVAGQTPVLETPNGLATILSLNGISGDTISGLTFAGTSVNGATAALNLTNSSNNVISHNVFESDGEGVLLDQGSSSNTLQSNQFDSSATSAVEVKNGSNTNTFSDNIINGTGATGLSGGGFYVHGSGNDIFANNLIENTAGMAIGIEDFGYGNTINQNNTITDNVILNAATSAASTDVGAVYLLDRSDVNMATTVSMNFISGVGNVNGSAHAEGIYLDDDSSGVTVASNIVKGVQSDAFEIHGGSNNSVTNNIFDLGTATRTAALLQQPEADWPAYVTPALTNDTITQNIILSQQASPLNAYAYFDQGSLPVSIFNNLYWDPNAPGDTLPMASPATDSHPVVGNPAFVNPGADNYGLGMGSAASSVGFRPINQALIGPQT